MSGVQSDEMCQSGEVCQNGGAKRLVPPDGGWGYAVAMAALITNVAMLSFMSSFGLLYRDIMAELEMSTTGLTTITSVNAMCFAIASYLTGPLLKVMSERKAAILSSVLINIGMVAQVFAYSQTMFMLCQCVMSFGSGWIIIITMSSVNSYFMEKKFLIMMLTQLTPSVTSVLAPLFVEWSNEFYGHRSTLLLVAGLTMHNFIASVILQPVEWHMKKVEELPESQSFIVNSLTTSKDSKIIAKELAGAKDVVVKITINETPEAAGSKISISKIHINPSDEVGNKSLMYKIGRALDWYMFKDFHFVLVSVGIALAVFADVLFISVLPKELEGMQWSQSEISWTLSLYGFGDIAGRLVLIAFSKPFARFGCKKLFMVGLGTSVLNRIGMIWSDDKTFIMVYLTTMGVSHCLLIALVPMVLSELVQPEQFSSALGVNTLIYGTVTLALGPVIGGIRDLTNSTPTMFCILTSCFAIVLLFWTIEICYLRNEKRLLQKKIETELSKKNKKNRSKHAEK